MPPALQEFDYQRAFILQISGNPDKTGRPRAAVLLRPDVVFWHTPNGGERRDAFEGARLKQMGVQAGIPDLLFLRLTAFTEGAFGLLFAMEWKKPDAKRIALKHRTPERLAIRAALVTRGIATERTVDMLSDAQLDTHARLLRAGLAASIVVDDLEDAKAFCRLHSLING